MELKNRRFTQRQKMIKGLQLELKPYGNTQKFLDEYHVIENDIQLNEKAAYLKSYIDKYMVAAIAAGLENMEFEWEEYHAADVEKRAEWESRLQTAVLNQLNSTGKRTSFSFAFNKEWLYELVPQFLKDAGYEEQALMFADMAGMTELFKKYITTYETAIKNWVPKRIVENFNLYLENITLFQRLLDEENPAFADLKNHFAEELEIFASPSGYCLMLNQNTVDTYNSVISGLYEDEKVTLRGYNEVANIENTRIRTENTEEKVYSKAKMLYKHIFTPSVGLFQIHKVTSNEELLDVFMINQKEMQVICSNLIDYAKDLEHFKSTTYVDGSKLTSLSYALFNNPETIMNPVLDYEEQLIQNSDLKPGEKKKKLNSLRAGINKKAYSIEQLEELTDENIAVLWIRELQRLINAAEANRRKCVESDLEKKDSVRTDKQSRMLMIHYLNSVVEVRDFVFLLKLRTVVESEVTEFNDTMNEYHQSLGQNSKALNLCRNYLSMKLKQETKKYQICFNTPLKLGGAYYKESRDAGKMTKSEYGIFRMDGKYYYGTIAKYAKPIRFERFDGNKEDTIHLLSVDKAQEAVKMLPKITFGRCKEHFETTDQSTFVIRANFFKDDIVVTRDMYDIYKNQWYKAQTAKKAGFTDEEARAMCEKLIIFYIRAAKNYITWSDFNLDELRDAEEYANINALCSHIDTLTISMKWMPISKRFFNEQVECGNLFAFLITNNNMYKDWATKTTYAQTFLDLLSDENLRTLNSSLNASPSIFFRPAVIPAKVAHKKGSQLVDKRDMDGNFIDRNIRDELYHYFNGRITEKELSGPAFALKDKVGHHESKEDIIYFKRYTEDKYLITFTYTINKKLEKDSQFALNNDIKEVVENNNNILSITRGVNHLLYYTVTNESMEILEEGDLDCVNGVNYLEKLKSLGRQRNENKKDAWEYDGSIVEIKDFYIRRITHDIANIALKYNAIIVLEDVGKATREKWACIDNQVFGKLEQALVRKMSCYTDKHTNSTEEGGLLNPYQFSSADFKGKYKGIVVCMSSAFSNVDIDSGFINLFNVNNINSEKKKRNFLSHFDSIIYDSDTESWKFKFDYKNFSNLKEYPNFRYTGQTEWILMAAGERTIYNREYKCYDYSENIATTLLEVIMRSDNNFIDGDILPNLDNLNADVINFLYEVFLITLKGVVKECASVAQEYRISPVTGKRMDNPMKSKCLLQVNKFLEYDSQLQQATSKTFKFDVDKWIKGLQNS